MHHIPCRSAIGKPECLPRDRHGKNGKSGEESTTDDEVLGRVQFEEQRLTGGQGAKLPTATWLPEVDFSQPGLSAKELEPLLVGDRNKCLHKDDKLREKLRDASFWPCEPRGQLAHDCFG